MSVQVRRLVARVVLVSALVGLVVAFLSAPAFAALGDTLASVTIPADAQCLGIGLRTAMATVQGSKLGFPQIPILLVTSCYVGFEPSALELAQRNKLFFLDPSTNPATLVRTVPTTFAPPHGWGALAHRPDKGDLIGCASHNFPAPHKIYAIDYSDFTTTANGTAAFLFDAQNDQFEVCDGLTWDPSNDTIYMGTDVNDRIYHYSATGTLLGTFPTQPLAVPAGYEGPNSCFKSGLSVVGGALFVGCNGEPNLFQLDKNTGVVIRSFTRPEGFRTEDLECDPVSFAALNKDALWSMNGLLGSNQLFAFEIPGGTCGFTTGPTVLNPGACPDNPDTAVDESTLDTDGDGLLDCWEDGTRWADGLPGIDFDGDGTRDMVLCVETNGIAGFQPEECADRNVKDLFVEFDSMAQHAPITTQLNQVITAFANAPVPNPRPGGLGPSGIRLHIQIDDKNIPHVDNTALPPCTPPPAGTDADFDTLKNAWFGTAAERGLAEPQRVKTLAAKKLAFRYGLSVHNLTRPANTASPSGCAEVPGNDFIVALGSFGSGIHRNGVGTQEYWAGTWMHEFGHTLGLRHGGGDNFNCKPNYLSIMSYPLQFKTVITDRRLNYSDRVLLQLSESALSEPTGIGGAGLPTGTRTVYGPGTAKLTEAIGPINWNAPTNKTTTDTVSNLDVNQIGNVSGCDGAGTTLVGFNDWASLVYNLRAALDFSDGIHSSAEEVLEITEPQAQELVNVTDADGDGIVDKNACGGAACVIDIVPGVASNKVLLFKHDGETKAIVPVAVLSNGLFDATMLNSHTLRFAGTPVSKVFGTPVCARLDVNRDGRRDLVCTFVVTGLSPGEQTAVLEGTTLSGIAIRAEGTMLPVQIPGDH